MKIQLAKSVLILCLILSITESAFTNPGSPTIISVSTSLDTFVAPTGSLQGGTLIYIKGTNFSPNSQENVITIWNYPCLIAADGAKEDTLTCRTTPATNPNQLYGLTVTVTVNGVLVSCNSNNCAFSYTMGRTPFIDQIIPRSVIGGGSVYVFGAHRIANLGDGRSPSATDIDYFLIGDRTCSLIDVIQNEDNYNKDYRSYIECTADTTQVAGEYSFTELVTPGLAQQSLRTVQTSYLTNNNYTQRVLAEIDSLSSHQGGANGQLVTVKGSGFSSNVSEYACAIAGETCSVVAASLTEVTVSVPVKSSGNTAFGALTADPADSSTRQGIYLGSNGAKYQRYDRGGLWKTTASWLTYLRGSPVVSLVSDKIITELSSPEAYGSDYVEYTKGYFYAPVDGVYRFSVAADDDFLMVMSTVKNNANIANLQNLLVQQNYNSFHYTSFLRANVTQSTTNVTLTSGYYYFEIVNVNYGGSGYFRVMVDMPSLRQFTANPTWQVDKIVVKPSQFDAEIIKVRVFAASGSFVLKYYDFGIMGYQTATINVGASASGFSDQLGNLPNIANYAPTVTVVLLDAAGNPTNSAPAGWQYSIILNRYRPTTPLPTSVGTSLVAGSVPASLTVTRTSTHSPPLTGTFSILINNVALTVGSSVNIPYNIGAWDIQYALNKAYPNTEINVNRVMNTQSQNSVEFIVQYIGLTTAATVTTIDTTLTQGGTSGTTPVGTVTVLREYSNRQFYSPIPYDFIKTASTLPSLQLSVKSLPVVCTDCSYQFNLAATPVISSASLSGLTYTIAVTDPSALGFTINDITVTMLGVQCANLAGTISSFTCTLPSNQGGSAQLPAGTGVPRVHVTQIGYADGSGLTSTTIPISVSTFAPAQTSPGGGIEATVAGSGFPISSSTGLSVTVCGNTVTTFTSISNKQLKFIVPPQSPSTSCTGSNNIISYNGQSTTFTFAYNPSIAPVITSLSKTSSSPVLKSSLTITGSNFNVGTTNVYLIQGGVRKYQLSVTSMTSTSINCILGGGKSGIYDVVVADSSNGLSTPDANSIFSYKIVVTSLNITSGQKGGGYLLTINGYNFATATGTNNVFIGDAKNSICKIVSSTSTAISCKVPRMMDDYTVDQVLDVVVTGRIIQESVCEGTCTFTYVDAGASVITLPTSTVYKAGDIVTVAGTGLTGATVTVNNVACVVNGGNDTFLNFTYPALPAGWYEVFINVASGWTYPQFGSNTVLSFDTAPTSSISYRGIELKISGNGIGAASSVNAWFVCSSTTKLTTLSTTPTSVVIQIPPYSGDAACNVNVTSGTYYRLFALNYRTNVTCAATVAQSNGGLTYTFTRTNMTTTYTPNKIQLVWLDSAGNPTSSKYLLTLSGMVGTATYLPAGTFQVNAHSNVYGFAAVTPNVVTVNFPADPTATAITTSFVGGKQMTISGAGFVTNNPANNQITVCGLPAKVISATTSSAVISIPALVTTSTQTDYSLATVGQITGTPYGDSSATAKNIADNSFNTIYTSTAATCYIGINFGTGSIADIRQIKFVPNPAWAIAAVNLDGAVFEGSNDGTTYTNIFTVDTSQVHSGWNTWSSSAAPGSVQYQYVRFSNTSLSACQLAEIKVYGIKYSTVAVTSGVDKTCDIVVKTQNKVIAGAVTYSSTITSVVNSVSPQFGPSSGNDAIHIVGTNFGTSSTITVTIDGIDCPVSSQTNTDIYCTTGVRAAPPAAGNSFVVSINGNIAKIATSPYLYIDRWSNTNTWGGQAIPRQGDTVYVPVGMTLLVDTSTPVLDTVIVQGKIQFEDTQDLTFDARYFVINGGEFQAGLENNRFQHKLVITLHGNYFDKQLPTLGSKVLGCRNCKFNMHGKQRTKTWTQVAATIMPGATSFTVIEAVDWVAGQMIAVASTSYDHYETQEMQIAAVSVDGLTITVTTPFKYKHFSATETYGSDNFVMRAEVGLLTRNIVVKGDDDSVDSEYGSHLMLTGKAANGLVGKISYAEFTRCGQPKIVGRYCTHFHMAGQVPDSYIRGISVHHSFARVLTIHGTHFLLIQKSVGFHVKGHNIFIEDGIETNNVIQDNLMMSSITSNTMLQSDMTVASYWITNPFNTVRRNHAAGGDFYGFWYEIKDHPDGPSATSDICPMGMKLGISQDNVAHTNRRFGLRIFKLSARKYPCITTQDESAQDPYIGNPPILSVFQNYTLWKNQQCGFLGEQLGYTTIRNFRTIDSRKGGMQFHKTNFTKELVTAENCLVVGFSSGNAPTNIDVDYDKARGVIASRTDGMKFSNIRFYNFGATMTPLQSCSECYHFKLWVTGGKSTYFENIHYTNILGKYIFWQKWRRQIFIDLDGSLTEPMRAAISPAIPVQTNAVISPYRPSLMVPGHCYTTPTGDLWDNSVYCDSTITLRGILFTNGIPSIDFNAIDIRVNLIANAAENVSLEAESNFSEEPMIIIKKSMDIKNSWAMPFATGLYYNVHWKWGIDFTHMAIAPSRLWDTNDGVVLRFNYSDHRQLFQIGKWYQRQLQLPFITASPALIDPTTCQNADYFHDPDNKYLYVCVSGRNKKIREWIDLNGIRCVNFCPTSNPTTQRESFSRLWSNVTQWPNQVLPVAFANVTIPYQWNLVLDIDPPILNYVEINGILIFDRLRDNKFQAHYIWVKQGIIQIGSDTSPFTKQANIILHGAKNDNYLVVDPDASGNKMLAVTGGLEFYGVKPDTVWTRLTQTATVGATTINVAAAAGWNVGDKIVIAPSYAGRKQFEEVNITAISGTTITFTPALTFEHYGAATTTIENNFGILDTRSAVGLLSRNIKVTPGPDPDNWGCRILVYGYLEQSANPANPPIWRNGYAKLKGVQIDRCGQYDTTLAALRVQNLGVQADTPNLVNTEVQYTSIHGCGGFCTFLKQISNVHFNNNVFFWARKFLVYVEEVNGKYNFTNNLLVGARKRDEVNYTAATMMVDDVAAYEHYFTVDFANPNLLVNVSNNLAQGSQGEGFVFPSTTCDLIDSYPFINNTAGSCQVAFMYERIEGQTCLAAKGCIGYASQIGLMANMPGSHQRVQYSKMFFADNQRGVTLRYAHQIDDNTLILKDSYITGFSRPTCTNCYSDATIKYCAGGYAVRMFTATITGETFPLKKKPTGHDVICTQQAYDFKAYLDNVVFENYLNTNPQLPYCSGMSVFRRHEGASDGTASHHLTNTQCLNCESKSWAYFHEPNLAWRGWFGGCGEIECTGSNNYLIHDQDGLFTGQKSQLLSNNSMIGDYEPTCTFIPEINGHWCLTEELAVMQYESIAPDFNKRKMWPVYLKYDGGAWNSTTNAWKEWQWDGPEPMNLRLARFWSVIKLHQNYNLTYSSQPPSDSRFQIQKRLQPTGNPADWAIVRIYYPLPNSIEVLVKNTTGTDILVKPYPIKSGIPQDLNTKTSICGANNFHYQNGTIEFVVNGIANCQVRVRLSSFIQLSARIDIPIADFYSNNGATSFITNICAFLGIDTGRMKIVGIKEGSVILVSVIQMPSPQLGNAQTTASNPASDHTVLRALQQRLSSGLNGGSINVGGNLLDFTTNTYIFNQDGTEYTPQTEAKAAQSKTLIIVLATVIPSVVLIAIVAGYCYWRRKRAQIHEAELVNNKSSVNRENIKGSTQFEISAADEFAATTKYGKKWGDATQHQP